MGLGIIQVNVFTDKPFAGNPAAVCILEQPRGEAWMQLVAREMNLSETAFLVKRERGRASSHRLERRTGLFARQSP
jgi:PhzF family phenazine biosynthesis protein